MEQGCQISNTFYIICRAIHCLGFHCQFGNSRSKWWHRINELTDTTAILSKCQGRLTDNIPSIEAIFDEIYRVEAVGWILTLNAHVCRHALTWLLSALNKHCWSSSRDCERDSGIWRSRVSSSQSQPADPNATQPTDQQRTRTPAWGVTAHYLLKPIPKECPQQIEQVWSVFVWIDHS